MTLVTISADGPFSGFSTLFQLLTFHLDPQKRRRRAQPRQELLRARGAAAPPGQVPAAEAASRLLPHQGPQEGPRTLRAQQLHG